MHFIQSFLAPKLLNVDEVVENRTAEEMANSLKMDQFQNAMCNVHGPFHSSFFDKKSGVTLQEGRPPW